MINALRNIPDCEFVELFTQKKDEQLFEYVICNIYSDEIPSRNEYGIEYCEKIAFVFGEIFKIPKTLVMRKGFPVTMHQYAISDGSPKILCLYEQPENVTLITWTPERHIQRTKWWLIQASHGKLHPDDQQVEQLLYNPSATIVVPHDLAIGLAQKKKLILNIHPNSPIDIKKIFFKVTWQTNLIQPSLKINLLEILTPAVIHGPIYSPPSRFPELITLMTFLGVDLVSLLRKRLSDFFINKEGELASDITVLLLTTPIRRSESALPERNQIIGFLCLKSVQEMLWELEVIIKENGLVNKNSENNLLNMTLDIPDFELLPMEVLQTTSAAARRFQSGYQNNIDKGILVGVGALGGTLLDIWSRGGWGKWTVIDNDTFRPHNFTRHIIMSHFAGYNKAVAVACTANFNFDEPVITAFNSDACQLYSEELKSDFSSAELVIDASASLDYPRIASLKKNIPRHLSAFFSPSGNDAVLLVEDKHRKIRLNSLESQYYRALIELPVGEKHLTQNIVNFRSGVSCRDVSTIMSHARILSLSALLADQIRFSSEQNNAQIKIWQDDKDTGCRHLTNVCVFKTKYNINHTGNKYQIFWDEGTEKKVKSLRENALPNETGGILVGYHDMTRKFVFIVDILPAPADSIGSPTSFLRGTEGIIETLQEIAKRTANNVSYIGEWHSHPDGISASMSKSDRTQLTELAEKLSGDGLPAYQMIVAKNEIRVYEKEVTRD